MTVQPELVDPTALKDPLEEFFRQGGIDLPGDEDEDGIDKKKVALVAVGLAAGFVLYRKLMKRELELSDAPSNEAQVTSVVARIWSRAAPLWAKAVLPAAVQAYKMGATGNLTSAEIEALASAYVANLGEEIHKSSSAALIEGFNAQLNFGWSKDLAWARSTNAYGLDKPQTRAYLSTVKDNLKDGYITDPIPAAAERMVDVGISTRAKRIGDTESWYAVQTGRNLVWMVQEERGALPHGMRKRWITAQDELVCGTCGPLNKRAVPLKSRFHAADGSAIYAPGAHPNCRCRIDLVYPKDYLNSIQTVIQKDMPGDPYDRDGRGRFAIKELRRTQSKTLERLSGTKERAIPTTKPLYEEESSSLYPEEGLYSSTAPSLTESSLYAPSPARRRLTQVSPATHYIFIWDPVKQSFSPGPPPPPNNPRKHEPLGFSQFCSWDVQEKGILTRRTVEGKAVLMNTTDPRLGDVMIIDSLNVEPEVRLQTTDLVEKETPWAGRRFDGDRRQYQELAAQEMFGVTYTDLNERQQETVDDAAWALYGSDFTQEEFPIIYEIAESYGDSASVDNGFVNVVRGEYYVADVEEIDAPIEWRKAGFNTVVRVVLEPDDPE